MIPSGLPALRTLGVQTTRTRGRDERVPDTDDSAGERVPNGRITPPAAPPAVDALPQVREAMPSPDDEPQLVVVPRTSDALEARLGTIEDRLQELSQAVERLSQTMDAALRDAASQQAMRLDAEEARRDAALERLRADILAAARAAPGSRPALRESRCEVSADLYAKLARLEAALAAVTNPVLLPGEPYLLPGEFLPEALVWENWNEVGERAFAFADAFSAQRLHLPEETRAEIGLFVTTLRTNLTGFVYPNLQAHGQGSRAHQDVLRSALTEIASELPRVRATLERAYREEERT
jgi:hypothetical protein